MEAKAKMRAAGQGSFLENPVVRNVMPCIGFVVICVVFMILTNGRIFAPANIKLLFSQTYVLMIACSGVFMVMTMGALDFSQGSLLGLSGVVICYLSTVNIVLAVIGGMITGGLIGLVNGFFNVKRQISSFIVTICNMFLLRGICAYLTTKSPVYAAADISKYSNVRFNMTFTVIILLILFLAFQFTGLGNRLKAIGAGETAARFAGIRVERTKILIYVLAGCVTGLASFINCVKVGSVTSSSGSQLETQIMIALVLGGMPVNGGAKVKFYNIILGALTYRILASGLVMMGLPPKTQQLLLGIIFLIEVALFSDRKTGMVVK